MNNHQELLKLATQLALSAGEILMEGRRLGFGTVETKSSSVDIVTEIDKASEDHIVSGIRSARPDDGVLGEEGTSFAGTSGVRWVVDPLDGTVNFTYGLPAFAVSIGIEIDEERVVGVVHNPAAGETFSAIQGEGAFLNGLAISVNAERALEKTLLGTGFSYVAAERKAEAEKLRKVLPAVRDIRRGGSAALDLCSVACGRLDAYYENVVKPWDVCGADVIATEAGALVTGLDGEIAVSDALAANPALHAALFDIVGSN